MSDNKELHNTGISDSVRAEDVAMTIHLLNTYHRSAVECLNQCAVELRKDIETYKQYMAESYALIQQMRDAFVPYIGMIKTNNSGGNGAWIDPAQQAITAADAYLEGK